MSFVIEVDHLSKHYKETRAVDDISFKVNSGEVYGFLGQNGAGKSTTIRMLLTLITPTTGNIRIFGHDLSTHRKEILRQVGAVIEKPDLYKYLSALENLSIFARLSGMKPTSAQMVSQLEMVGLKQILSDNGSNRLHSKVKTYSQGMKQRLGIAVALIHNPQLIILDEPTNGLDPQGIADIRNLILQLSREHGKTIFVSSHLLNEIEMIADRVLILDKGRKLVEGNAQELFNTSNILVQVDVINPGDVLQSLRSSPWNSRIAHVENGSIMFRLDKSLIPKLTADLVNMNAQLVSLSPKDSLEDYFLSLTASKHVDSFAN